MLVRSIPCAKSSILCDLAKAEKQAKSLLFCFGGMKRARWRMKNEVACGYEACLRHIGNKKRASLHGSVSECFILAKPMLHFSLKKSASYDILN